MLDALGDEEASVNLECVVLSTLSVEGIGATFYPSAVLTVPLAVLTCGGSPAGAPPPLGGGRGRKPTPRGRVISSNNFFFITSTPTRPPCIPLSASLFVKKKN